MASQKRIFIGIDFGTTFSGIAVAHTDNPRDIWNVDTWPGRASIISDKVPTELAYEANEETTGKVGKTTKNMRWGFTLKEEQPSIKWLKLFLDPSKTLPDFVSRPDTEAQLALHGKSVVDAISDYLTKIHERAMTAIEEHYRERTLRESLIEFVLTIPAVWSDRAKSVTLEAAKRAGMGENLRVISEPEAAAVWTMYSSRAENLARDSDSDNNSVASLSVGEHIVVCDAGGGTVDVISYKVVTITPLLLEEAHIGTGGLCGAAFLNLRFEDHVKERFGEVTFNRMKEENPMMWPIAMSRFEDRVKRNFTGTSEDSNSFIPITTQAGTIYPGVELEKGCLKLTPQHVSDIFEPVIVQVLALIENQTSQIQNIGKGVDVIVLAGGFSQSGYLYSRIKDHFKDSSVPHTTSQTAGDPAGTFDSAKAKDRQSIEVIKAKNAWAAVSRGAVLRGLEGSIVRTRRARSSYGIVTSEHWNQTKYPKYAKYWCELEEIDRAKDVMEWYLLLGAEVSEKTGVSLAFYYTLHSISFTEKDAYKKTVLYACSDIVAPVMHSERFLQPKRNVTSGKKYWILNFNIDMFIDSASMIFTLNLDGVSYASASIVVSFDN